MASKTQKKSAASGTKRGGNSPKKKRTAPAPAKSRPIRREIGGAAAWVLALCAAVSYVQKDALFLNWFAVLLKGLFGYGYYLAAPALALAGGILLFHHGRPVALRVSCTLLLPVLLGGLGQLLLSSGTYKNGFGILKVLWQDGQMLHSGGAVSGLLAVEMCKGFGKIVSVVLFALLLVGLAAVALRPMLLALMERYRDRVLYEEEEEEETLPPAIPSRRGRENAARSSYEEPPRRLTQGTRPQIDIPLDGEQRDAVQEKKPSGRFTSFFRHKSDQQKTPDQVLMEKMPDQQKTPARPAAAIAENRQPDPVFSAQEKPITPPEKPIAPPPSAIPMDPPSPPAPPAVRPAAPAEPPASGKKQTAQEVAAATAAVTAEIAEGMAAGEDAYQYPPITLLKENQGENCVEAGAELRNNSRRLGDTLSSFGVDATPADVVHGPSVTRYEFVLDQGVKLSKITNLADDIALALGASGVRIAPIPDKISVVGIEVPNKQVTPVLIRDVIESREFTTHKSDVAFAVGKDISGRSIVGDIGKLPHVLIAGTTGSGKSVCTNSLIVSLLYKSSPDQVRFIMVDPKMVELAPYNGIPHLLIPVVTDPKKAAGALQWAVFEMMKRYKLFSEHGVKKLEEYNQLARAREDLETIPSVVVVIDELADLMLVAAKEVEESICRVAQMGRAAGMHLVIATQRPSADVITGLMKANIPSRIAFAVASSLESRIILDTTGAEKLVGKGDMLYAPLGAGKPIRVQGCFISPEEIERVVEFVKQTGEAQYSDEVIAKIEESLAEKEKGGGRNSGGASAEPAGDEGDELLPAAVDVVLETGQASVSMLQRRLKLGYSRAARLVDQMEERGIVGPFEGSKPRQVLISKERWQELQMLGGRLPDETAVPETAHLPDET